MSYREPSAEEIQAIMDNVGTIAIVGASDDPSRPSHAVMRFLIEEDFRVFPVNPRLKGARLFGEKVFGSLAEIKEPIDMVEIFRKSDEVEGIVHEAIAVGTKVIWLPLGIMNEKAAEKALAAGLKVVMNRCPKLELSRMQAD